MLSLVRKGRFRRLEHLQKIIRSYQTNPKTIPKINENTTYRLGRPLGLLERYLYDWNTVCNDTYVIQVTVTSKVPVTNKEIFESLSKLQDQHPFLRSILKKCVNTVQIVPSDEMKLPLQILEKEKFDRMFRTCSLEKELWKIAVLKGKHMKHNELTFILALHTILSDYVYVRHIIRDFINCLEYNHNERINNEEFPQSLSEPIEKVTENVDVKHKNPRLNIITNSSSQTIISAFDVFVCKEQKYPAIPSNLSKILNWRLDKNTARSFESFAKSMNGTLLAVCVKSFMNLIENTLNCCEMVEMPVTFMVNLRRYVPTTREFRGNGSVEAVCYLQMEKGIEISDLIINISQKVCDMVKSGEVLRRVREDLQSEISRTKHVREIIALSHLGHIDDILGTNTSFELKDVRFNINSSSDLSPVFDIITYYFKGELHFSMAYCSTVTSDETARRFSNNVNTIIKQLISQP